MDDLKTNILRKIKHAADNLFFPHQDRFSTYLYYLPTLLFANRRFMSTPEFIFITTTWIKTLPRKFDIVIGIPRKGMILAYIAGIELGIPVATIDTFKNRSFQIPTKLKQKKQYQNILLIDDCVGVGVQMKKAKEELLKINPKLKISTAAPFVTSDQAKNITYYYTINKGGALATELDLTRAPMTVTPLCVDLDGVLCEDSSRTEREEDKAQFWITAKPNKIPSYMIDAIVTGRPEKYRDLTERWLKRNRVKYKNLIMAQNGDDGIKTKVRAIRKIKPGIFWESSPYQSRIIFLKTGCRVLCLENSYLYGGDQSTYVKE